MEKNKVRLQKYLSACGVASRRSAEKLIEQGAVKVGGRPASIGDSVDPKRDIVTVRGKRVTGGTTAKVYIMLHKPRGIVTTLKDELGRKTVAELVSGPFGRVYPVGRLDRDSEGLLLMTNDGDFANKVAHPSFNLPKTYRVTVRGRVSDDKLGVLTAGVMLDGEITLPAAVDIIGLGEDRTVLSITITEGKNRQIRRMCEQLSLDVMRLKRIKIGGLKLGMLAPGKWRYLTKEELRQFK